MPWRRPTRCSEAPSSTIRQATARDLWGLTSEADRECRDALLLGTGARGHRRLESLLVQPGRSGHAGADPDWRRLDAAECASGLVARPAGLLGSTLLGLTGCREGLPSVARRCQSRHRRQLLVELPLAGRFAGRTLGAAQRRPG